MRMPKRIKFRKQQRGTLRGNATRGNYVAFGDYGLQALAGCRLTARQIEAARIAMTRHATRVWKMWISHLPDNPITMQPSGARKGMGNGNPEERVAAATPGRIFHEVARPQTCCVR